jgi:hypothetical protein
MIPARMSDDRERTTPWPADLADDDLLARLLALNRARAAGAGGTGPP